MGDLLPEESNSCPNCRNSLNTAEKLRFCEFVARKLSYTQSSKNFLILNYLDIS